VAERVRDATLIINNKLSRRHRIGLRRSQLLSRARHCGLQCPWLCRELGARTRLDDGARLTPQPARLS
jgi:hypothetical protein